MDSGDILYQEKIKIEDNDNVGTMFEKLSILGSKMIIDFLPKLLSGDYNPIKQDEDEGSYAFNISPELINIFTQILIILTDFLQNEKKPALRSYLL